MIKRKKYFGGDLKHEISDFRKWIFGRYNCRGSKKGMLPDYELVGILGRSQEKTKALAKKADCEACFTITELLAQKPDIVAEAALERGRICLKN